MNPLSYLSEDLAELARLGLRRFSGPVEGESGALIDLTSNDYLGLGREGVSRETLLTLQSVATGARASRLLDGTHPAHQALEASLAQWVGTEASLLFASGYAANVGLLSSLAGPNDVIISDQLNHASIVDGCRLSRATVRVVRHLDLGATEEALRLPARRRYLVTESLFSMDGDSPDLLALRRLCDAHQAVLIVDEAHAVGVLGPRGAGLCAAAGMAPDVLVGTLGKALGTSGAFVAGPTVLRDWLWNKARSFVFSTGTSPLIAAITQVNLERVQAADSLRRELQANATALATHLRGAGLAVPSSAHAQIIPVIFGTPEDALDAAQILNQQGIRIRAVRPPTVPEGTSRLRVTLNSRVTAADLAKVTDALLALSRRSQSKPIPDASGSTP